MHCKCNFSFRLLIINHYPQILIAAQLSSNCVDMYTNNKLYIRRYIFLIMTLKAVCLKFYHATRSDQLEMRYVLRIL